jgi:hypothetical protein
MKPTTDQQRWPSRASNGVALLPRICHTSHADESVTFDEIDDRQNCFFAQSPKAKHRGKGQQKVIVEHVHVYQGGQAIVGNVAPGGAGKNSEVQPHAVTYAPGATMRGENPQCEALPVVSNAERTLQDARGTVPRGVQGQSKRP